MKEGTKEGRWEAKRKERKEGRIEGRQEGRKEGRKDRKKEGQKDGKKGRKEGEAGRQAGRREGNIGDGKGEMDGWKIKDHDCSIPEGRYLTYCVSPTVTDKRIFPASEHLSWHPNPCPNDLRKVSVQNKHKTRDQEHS